MLKRRLLASALGVSAVLLGAATVLTVRGSGGQTPSLRLLVAAQRETYPEGEKVVASLRMENVGRRSVLVLWPVDAEGFVAHDSNCRVSVVSSNQTVKPLPCLVERESRTRRVVIAAGCPRRTALDLQRLFGPLKPDAYTVFARYEASADAYAGGKETDPAQPFVGRADSNLLEFRVVAHDQARVVESYSAQWKSATDNAKRLEALFWLERNALRQGMEAACVERLLGKPSEVRSEGQEWVYRVRLTGVIVRFDGCRVVGYSRFEV